MYYNMADCLLFDFNSRVFHARIKRGGTGIGTPPWKITKLQGSLAILFQIPLKVTKLPSQHSRLDLRWHVNDGPLLIVEGSSLPSSTKKKYSGTAHVFEYPDFHPCVLNYAFGDKMITFEFRLFLQIERQSDLKMHVF